MIDKVKFFVLKKNMDIAQNKQDRVEKLICEISGLSKSKFKTKTAFLETSKLKKEIEKKLKEGIPMRAIHKVIKDLDFSISLATFRDWVKANLKLKG